MWGGKVACEVWVQWVWQMAEGGDNRLQASVLQMEDREAVGGWRLVSYAWWVNENKCLQILGRAIAATVIQKLWLRA